MASGLAVFGIRTPGSCSARFAARRLAKIAPKRAIPIEPPICRNRIDPDGGDAHQLLVDRVLDGEHQHLHDHPDPDARRPACSAAAVQIELPVPSRESRSRPTVMTNVPTIGKTL